MSKTSSTLALVLSLGLLASAACNGHIPVWNGKIFAGDSAKGGISRAQAGEFVSASDPKFDEYMAMSWDDFQSFYETYVLGCKEWKAGVAVMSASEAWQKLKVVQQMRVKEAPSGTAH